MWSPSSEELNSQWSSPWTPNQSRSSSATTSNVHTPRLGPVPSWPLLDFHDQDAVDDILASPHLNLINYPANHPNNNPYRSHRRPPNRDEFDGPHQFLPPPTPEYIKSLDKELPHLPTNLLFHEQAHIFTQLNDRLSRCAFDFIARYQFPVPLSLDYSPVEKPYDRDWTNWAFLLKRLAAKRRIPARVLYNGQIRQFGTILDNSLETRYHHRTTSWPLKDDRHILQSISAATHVAQMLKDAPAMISLINLYESTEQKITERTRMTASSYHNK